MHTGPVNISEELNTLFDSVVLNKICSLLFVCACVHVRVYVLAVFLIHSPALFYDSRSIQLGRCHLAQMGRLASLWDPFVSASPTSSATLWRWCSHLQLWKRHEGDAWSPARQEARMRSMTLLQIRNGSWEPALLAVPATLNKMVIVLLCPEDSILHMTDDVSNNCCQSVYYDITQPFKIIR